MCVDTNKRTVNDQVVVGWDFLSKIGPPIVGPEGHDCFLGFLGCSSWGLSSSERARFEDSWWSCGFRWPGIRRASLTLILSTSLLHCVALLIPSSRRNLQFFLRHVACELPQTSSTRLPKNIVRRCSPSCTPSSSVCTLRTKKMTRIPLPLSLFSNGFILSVLRSGLTKYYL